MQKIGKVQTPRCRICNKAEFKNKVFYGYVWNNEVRFYGDKEIMCKDCEAKQKVIAKTQYSSEPIYERNF